MASNALAVALSGGVASVLARAVVWPADVVRTVQAVQGDKAVRSLTARDYYRGVGLACLDAFTYHAVNFGVYSLLQAWWVRRPAGGRGPLSVLLGLAMGILSGGTAQVRRKTHQNWGCWASSGLNLGPTQVACQPLTTLTTRMSTARESALTALRGAYTLCPAPEPFAGIRASPLSTELHVPNHSRHAPGRGRA